MFTNILVAVDGSEHGERAADCAGNLAAKYGARVTLLHVMSRTGTNRVPPGLRDLARMEHIQASEAELLEGIANSILTKAHDRAHAQGAKTIETVTELGDPAHAIIDHCQSHGIDLIVMGRRGLSDLAGLFMGSVSHKVANVVGCPCLTVS